MLYWSPQAPYTAEQLLEVLHILRDPENGCPWDKVQTSLHPEKLSGRDLRGVGSH